MPVNQGSHEYPAREFLPPDRYKSYVAFLLKRLEKLERETHPDGGGKTTQGKDRKAREALQCAGELVRTVAGWAIDHQLGLALAGLEFVPLAISKARELPAHKAKLQAVDDHQHEKSGGAIGDGSLLDSKAARQALINLLIANPGHFPDALRHQVIEALRALNYGEVLPLLAPAGLSRKVGYRELQLQLKSLCFVAFRVRSGATARAALETVAEAYHVSPETLRSWERRLRKEFGDVSVESSLENARNIAANRDSIRREIFKIADELPDDEREGVRESAAARDKQVDAAYGDKALEDAADRYRKLKRRISSI